MDFVQLPAPNWLLVILLVILIVLAIAGCGVIIGKTKPKLIPVLSIGVLIGVIAISGGFAIKVASADPKIEQIDLVTAQIKDVYGKEISPIQVWQTLSYPSNAPSEDFRVYGYVVEDIESPDGFVRSKTYLLWKEGKMVLATSTDGENFSVVEKR